MEVFVGDEETVEEGTQYVGLEPRATTSHHFCLRLSVLDALSDGWKTFARFLHLGSRHLILIHIETGQTDIGVGHVDGEDRIHLPVKPFAQDGVSIADVITTSHHHPYVFGRLDFCFVLVDVFSHHFWDAPSIDGKDHAEHVFLIREQPLQFVGYPLAVTRS